VYHQVMLLTLGMAAFIGNFQDTPLSSEQIYKRVLPSVMTIVVDRPNGEQLQGTGFLAIKDNLAVTAWHVVKGASHAVAKFSDGEEFEVSGLVDKDEKRDLALIRVKVSGRPVLDLLGTDPPIGQKAFVIGAPRGLEFSISDGIISQIRLVYGVRQVQFSCPASPGNSGGPLINPFGQVIGIVDWQISDGQNLNFAVPSVYAKGLDSSLPTVSWSDVKPIAVQAQEHSQPLEEIDSCIAKSVGHISDTYSAVNLIDRNIVRKKNGYKNGFPAYGYTLQKLLADDAKLLGKLRTQDGPRQMAIKEALSSCMELADGLETLSKSILAAGNSNGWDAAANDLCSRAFAIFGANDGRGTEVFGKLGSDKVFLDHIPNATVRGLFVDEDDTGFTLGCNVWAEPGIWVSIVGKGSLAEKLRIEDGDFVQSANGVQISTMIQLKREIKLASGRELTLIVKRQGQEKTIKVKVPSELPPRSPKRG
jgi:S1-C subfamily serine protease